MPRGASFCDNCGRETKTRRLDLGGHSGINLCRGCWSKEMAWRRARNKELSSDARFPIRKYPA